MTRLFVLVVAAAALCVSCGSASKNAQPEFGMISENEPPEVVAPPIEGINVASKADPAVDFKEIKTYAWAAAGGALNDPEGIWTIPEMNVGKEIMFLIDRELRARGLTEVKENPDVLAVYAVLVDMEAVDLKDDDNTLAFGETVPAGALYIALANAETEEAIWVGAAASKVDVKPQTETIKARLDYAVTQIIARLPQ